jgi:short-subunit dehydrogenase
MELRNSVGILTGASRGIGVHIAHALADNGVHLALAARSADALETTAEAVRARGVRAITVPADITNRADLEKLVERTTNELGPIDLLVNNAGREMVGYFERLDPDEIAGTIETNLLAPILLSRLVVPGMIERGRGHIVNIASAAAKVARPYGGVYSASKHGVVGFSWSLRAELAARGVEVTVVCPAYVTGEGMFAEREARAGKIPGPLRPVTPQKVAQETIKSIEKNRAEVVVGPLLAKTSDVFHAISPSLSMAIGRRTGLYGFLKREATGE